MRFDARSVAVLERASRGPAAMALRLARSRGTAPISNVAKVLTTKGGPTRLGALCLAGTCRCGSGLGSLGAAGGATPAPWQVDPTALRQLISQVSSSAPAAVAAPPAPAAVTVAPANISATVAALRSSRLMGFGSLGFSPTTGQAASVVGSKAAAAGATDIAAYAGAGSFAGPIGVAAGVVIALAITLFTKQYFNVGQSNQLCQQLEALFQKYTTIQGYVAGRALGWTTMNQLMHAATGAGLFPGNDMHLAFHEGTLQCAGHGDWVDAFTGYTAQGNAGAACGAHNCMADALRQFNHGNVPAGTPDAIYYVDSILLPMNDPNHAKIPWIYNGAQNPQVHQLLYDMADAYLAQFSSGTVPFVQYPQSQVGTPTPGAISAPAQLPVPSQLVPPQNANTPSTQNMLPALPGSGVIYNPLPAGSAAVSQPVPGGTAVVPSPLPGAPATTPYYATPGGGMSLTPTPGSTPVVPSGYTGAATVGTSGLSTMTMLALGGGLLALALLLPKRRQR